MLNSIKIAGATLVIACVMAGLFGLNSNSDVVSSIKNSVYSTPTAGQGGFSVFTGQGGFVPHAGQGGF